MDQKLKVFLLALSMIGIISSVFIVGNLTGYASITKLDKSILSKISTSQKQTPLVPEFSINEKHCKSFGGKDYYKNGGVTVIKSNGRIETKKDKCIDNNILREYYCMIHNRKFISSYEDYTCPTGCSEGSCNCYDPDDPSRHYANPDIANSYGFNIYTASTVLSTGSLQGYNPVDQCADFDSSRNQWYTVGSGSGAGVKENYCFNSKYSRATWLECPSRICKNGACISCADSGCNGICYEEKCYAGCSDSDYGANQPEYYISGRITITDENGNKKILGPDYCDGSILIEFNCNSQTYPSLTERYDCKKDGLTCSEGMCVKQNYRCTDSEEGQKCSDYPIKDCANHPYCYVKTSMGLFKSCSGDPKPCTEYTDQSSCEYNQCKWAPV